MYIRELGEKQDLWDIYPLVAGEPGFFLDSSLFDKQLGSYSFMGYNPRRIIRSKNQVIESYRNGGWYKYKANPLAVIDEIIRENGDKSDVCPFPFAGGLVGYLSYDLKNQVEKLPQDKEDKLKIYDQYWGVYDTFLVQDHLQQKIWVAGYSKKEVDAAINDLKKRLQAYRGQDNIRTYIGELRSNFKREEYIAAIKKVKDYIRKGDIYQANLSQCFSFKVEGSIVKLYDILRAISPSYFGAFMHFNEFDILSISPERFIKIVDGIIETRPIKGTRPRGRNRQEDERLMQELKESIKDQAELLMIVDLERNDLGRICRPGTVKVRDLFRINTYATLFHLDATVTGQLRKNLSYEDIIKATFPGGSITGAPKIKAMEIIDELEPDLRGVYTGSVGYIDYRGNCDLNIAIRTAVVKDGYGYYQAGGGLVIDSDPDMEYDETWDKTRSMVLAREEANKIVNLV